MKNAIRWTAWSAGALFLLSLALPAAAQQMTGQQGQQQMQQQQPQMQQKQQGQQGQQQQQAQRGQQGRQQAQLVAVGLEPINQVAVAFDFDQDGQIDAVDFVQPNLPPMLIVDRQLSGRQGQMMQRQAQQRQFMQQGRTAQAYKVQGTVQDMRTTRIAGSDEQRVFARVQTQQGQNVAVDLGPQWKVQQLNLKQGDQIAAFGRISRIDERPVLSAFNVRAGDRRISVPAIQGQMTQPGERFASRYDVTLLKTRTDQIPGGPSVVLGQVRLQDGSTTLVNLGPQNQLQNINLQQNQNLRILARPVRIEGQQALVAERVAAGNQQVDIDWNQVRAGQQAGSPS